MSELPDQQQDERAGLARNCYAFQARKTANALLRAYNDWLKPVDLELAQFTTLCAILDGRARSIGDLADVLGVERTTLVRNLKVLQKRGLIAIDARQQRRLTHRLTPEGAETLKRALPLWEQAQAAMQGALQSTSPNVGGPDLRDLMRELRGAVPLAFARGQIIL
jgi:DNA-binding MarR family transcriptional regulator